MLRLYILTQCVSLCEWNSSNIIKSFKKILLFDLCQIVWFLAKRFILCAGHWVFGHWAKPKWAAFLWKRLWSHCFGSAQQPTLPVTEPSRRFKCPADRNTSNTIKSFQKNILFDLCRFVWFLAKRLILCAGHWATAEIRHSYENDYGRIASAPLSNRHCQSQNQAEDSSVLRTEIHQIQSNPSKKSFVWFVLVCLISRAATHEFRSLSEAEVNRNVFLVQVSCGQKFIKYNQILPKKHSVWFVSICLISRAATYLLCRSLSFRSLSEVEVSGVTNQNSCSKTCARAACI